MDEDKILIVTGEPSGDLHAGNLVKELLNLKPNLKILAVGSENLKKAGADIFYDIKDLAVFGFFDVLKKLPKFIYLKKLILKVIKEEKPKLIILVDFAGFNLRLAKVINKTLPIIYYISPQVWASRAGRIKTIKKYISKMIVFFKFEEELYRKEKIEVDFVGHPLLEIVKSSIPKEEFLKKLGFSPIKNTIALLPGSRAQEIKNILPIMLKVASYINKEIPSQFLIVKSLQIEEKMYTEKIKDLNLEIKVVEGKNYDCLGASDFALVCSGTATLETAIMGVPFFIIYKMNLLNYLLYRPQVKIPYIGMVNIIAKRKIIPEFIQFKAKPKIIAKELIKTLKDSSKIQEIKDKLIQIKNLLGPEGANRRAAKIILGLLNS